MVYNMPNRTTETNVTIGYNKEKTKYQKVEITSTAILHLILEPQYMP